MNTSIQNTDVQVDLGIDLASALAGMGDTTMANALAIAKPAKAKAKGKGKPIASPHASVTPVEPTATILPQVATGEPLPAPTAATNTAPATVPLPADQIVIAGMAALASAVEAALYSGGNVFLALASFGEASGLAGKRGTTENCLRVVASDPDRFIPAGISPNVRARIIRMVDKGKGPEFSRSVNAITAGSVLAYYVTKARTLFDANPAATGWTRVIQRLVVSTLSDARSTLGKPVDASWAGLATTEICLPTILAKASETEVAVQSGTNAKRVAGSVAPPVTGSAGRAASPGVLVPAKAQAQADATLASVANMANNPNGAGPAAGKPPVNAYVGRLQNVETMANVLGKDAPDSIRAAVTMEVEKILASALVIRNLYAGLNTQVSNPIAGLALPGFEGFKIG